MHFNSNGIKLIQGDEWVQFYHTFFNDPAAASMIENRMKMNEIIQIDGRFDLSGLNMDCVETERETITSLIGILISVDNLFPL